jgi:hypothetical protein
MSDWDTEPYQDEVNKIKCKFCNEKSHYDFCNDGCRRAYWSEMD